VANTRPALSEISRAVFEYLKARPDAVLFGAHAVNAYVEPARMTADVDIMSTAAAEVAEELRRLLAERFHIAARVRVVANGCGFRVYQVRKPKNRHLVDVRQVDALPKTNTIKKIRVIIPSELIILKLASYMARGHTEKGLSDRLDLHRLLRVFPQLRSEHSGPVAERLVSAPMKRAWGRLLLERIEQTDDDDY